MAKIVLNFAACKYLGEFHKVLKEGFGFPDYYGENLDALWDCLSGYCDYPLTVEINGIMNFSRVNFEHEEYVRKVIQIFKDVHDEDPNIEFVLIS